jgi:hypothetical protein
MHIYVYILIYIYIYMYIYLYIYIYIYTRFSDDAQIKNAHGQSALRINWNAGRINGQLLPHNYDNKYDQRSNCRTNWFQEVFTIGNTDSYSWTIQYENQPNFY